MKDDATRNVYVVRRPGSLMINARNGWRVHGVDIRATGQEADFIPAILAPALVALNANTPAWWHDVTVDDVQEALA